jgi:hypothetical protein
MAPPNREEEGAVELTGGDNAEDAQVEEDSGKDSNVKRFSSHASGMDSSVFRFKNVNFKVGTGDTQKSILQDVSAVVKWGRKLLVTCRCLFACSSSVA